MSDPVQNEIQPQPKPQELADAGAFVKPAITPEAKQAIKVHDTEETEKLHNELGKIPLNPVKVEALKAQPTSDSIIPEVPREKEKFEDTKRLLHVVEVDKRNLVMNNLPKEDHEATLEHGLNPEGEEMEEEELRHAA